MDSCFRLLLGKERWVLVSGSEKATAVQSTAERDRERRAINDGSWVGESVGRSVNEN